MTVTLMEHTPLAARASVGAWVTLTKARLNALVALTAVAGAVLALQQAAPARPGLLAVAAAVVGSTLAALGACALNQVLERDRDARMRRTRGRPIPSGQVAASTAAAVGLALLAGGAALALSAGLAAALVTALGGALYVAAYTPLKPVTPLAFVPGALAGAAPPVVGWLAAGGGLDGGALALAGLLLAWQLPHVAAIDWVHRLDHARAGLRTLAAVEPTGRATGRAALVGALALVAAGAAPAWAGMGSAAAGAAAAACGLPVVALSVRLRRERGDAAARRLFLATLLHLPLVLGLYVVG